MAQTIKGWILLGRKKGETKWQLVDFPVLKMYTDDSEDENEDLTKMTGLIFYDKDEAVGLLEELREGETEDEYRLGTLYCEVGDKKGRD